MVVGPVTPNSQPVQPQTPPTTNVAPPPPPAPPPPQTQTAPPPRTDTVHLNRTNGRDQVQISRQAAVAANPGPTQAGTAPAQPGRKIAGNAAQPANPAVPAPVRPNPPAGKTAVPNPVNTAPPVRNAPAQPGAAPNPGTSRGQAINLIG